MALSEKITLIFIDIVFFSAAIIAAVFGKLPPIPEGWFLVLLGLAAYRGGRAVSFNYIFKWLRHMFNVVEEDDSSGAGESTTVKGTGVMRTFGELICCPICVGTWVGLTMLLIYSFFPAVGTALIYATAAAGIAELLNWVSEFFFWKGRSAREESGSYWLYKNRPEVLRSLDERTGRSDRSSSPPPTLPQ